MVDYKHTINLPQTGFSMKADLAQREPKMLADWQARDLYGKVRAASRGGADGSYAMARGALRSIEPRGGSS